MNIHATDNWGLNCFLLATMVVKSVETFPVLLVKLATPPLLPQTKLNLEMSAFLAIILLEWGGGGGLGG